MHGYHHVIKELTRDNQGLMEKIRGLEGDLELAKEEIRLLEDIKEGQEGGEGEWRRKAEKYAETIKEVRYAFVHGCDNVGADITSSRGKYRNWNP